MHADHEEPWTTGSRAESSSVECDWAKHVVLVPQQCDSSGEQSDRICESQTSYILHYEESRFTLADNSEEMMHECATRIADRSRAHRAKPLTWGAAEDARDCSAKRCPEFFAGQF
jgi:hypothetical protein